jgi:hypothetical protein
MKKDMQPKKNSKLNKYLKIFLYFLLVTGVCAILPIPGGHLWRGLHVFAGFIFLILVSVHMGKNWKWYKAWITGKLKNEKSKLSKSITGYFFLMLFSLSFDAFLPENIFLIIHIGIGSLWSMGMIKHFKGKQKRKVEKVSKDKHSESLISKEQVF